jgi:glycerol-3-phosphate acyltransferase PlsY
MSELSAPTLLPWLYAGLAVLLSYLVGSLSFAVITSRLMGLADPRSYGSKNPGATNVLRSGNKKAAALTLLLDALKGLLPVLLAAWVGERFGLWGAGTVAACGLAAFLGHLYPVFFGFQGGKGVATALGVLLALNVWMGLATALTWLIIAVFFRYSSLASMISAVFAVFYWLLNFGIDRAAPFVLAMSVLLIWRHRANIDKLLAGKEARIGDKAGAAAPPATPAEAAAAHYAAERPKRRGHKRH